MFIYLSSLEDISQKIPGIGITYYSDMFLCPPQPVGGFLFESNQLIIPVRVEFLPHSMVPAVFRKGGKVVEYGRVL